MDIAARWSRTSAPTLWAALDAATQTAERHLGGETPSEWWVKMGHTAQVPLQVASLRAQLDQHPELRTGTICEIGFNAGHSAVLWLEGTETRVILFDLLGLPYSIASRRFVDTRYPGRTSFHVGDSKTTVRSYADRVLNGTARPCDLWSIDGDHGIHAKIDFLNALDASRDGTIVVADDAGLRFPFVRKFWRIHVGIGSIHERGCVITHAQGVEKTWCIGAVAPVASGRLVGAALRTRFDTALAMSREERNAAYFRSRRRGEASRSLALRGVGNASALRDVRH